MKTDKTEFKLCRKAMMATIVGFVVLYCLNCIVIPPIYTLAVSDIALAESILPTILSYSGTLFELIAVSLCYAAAIFVMYIASPDVSKKFYGIFAVATFGKYIAQVIYAWVENGSIPRMWGWDVVNAIFFTGLEFILFMIAYSISKKIIESSPDKKTTIKSAGDIGAEEQGDVQASIYPFKKLYDPSNCLMRSAAMCGIVTMGAKLFGAVVNDIWTMALGGLPEKWTTVVAMALTYASYVIFGVICYFVMYVALSLLFGSLKNDRPD